MSEEAQVIESAAVNATASQLSHEENSNPQSEVREEQKEAPADQVHDQQQHALNTTISSFSEQSSQGHSGAQASTIKSQSLEHLFGSQPPKKGKDLSHLFGDSQQSAAPSRSMSVSGALLAEQGAGHAVADQSPHSVVSAPPVVAHQAGIVAEQVVANANDQQQQEQQQPQEAAVGALSVEIVPPAPLVVDPERLRHELQNTVFLAHLERKKQAYEDTKKWEVRHSQVLAQHIETCDSILARLRQHVKLSTDSLVLLVRFFQERRNFELAYGKALLQKQTRLQNAFAVAVQVLSPAGVNPHRASLSDSQGPGGNANPSLHRSSSTGTVSANTKPGQPVIEMRGVYPRLSSVLRSLDVYGEIQSKKVNDLAQYIEKNVLLGVLDKNIREYETQVKRLNEQIKLEKQVVLKCEQDAQKRSIKYQKVYNDIMGNDASGRSAPKRHSPKDLYNWELKYRLNAQAHINQQRQYGAAISTAWETLHNLETTRLEQIQMALLQFVSKQTDTFGKTEEGDTIMRLLNEFMPSTDAREHFSLNKMLSTGDVVRIQKHLNRSELTPNDVHEYLSAFSVPENTEPHPLVLRVYRAYRDSGTVGTTWRPVDLVLTVDDSLLVFDEKHRQSFLKPKYKLKLRFLKTKTPSNDRENNKLDLIEERPGVLFSSTMSIRLKFDTSDYMEEFAMHVKKYREERLPEVQRQ